MLESRQHVPLDFSAAVAARVVKLGHRGGERGTGGICRDSSSSAGSSVWQWHTDRVHLWGPDIASCGREDGFQAAGGVSGLLSVRVIGSPLAGGSSARFPCGLSTKPGDPTTGYYYFGHRWNKVLTGRWDSRDPIEVAGEVELYGFEGNDGGIVGIFSAALEPHLLRL